MRASLLMCCIAVSAQSAAGCYSSRAISSDAASEAPACVPDCGGLECGDDGCGGSCGECPAMWACARGVCIIDACEWTPADCDPVTPEDLCEGARYVRYDTEYEMWVCAVDCDRGYRLYLGTDAGGPYYPIVDMHGHGEDHCELLDPGFHIPDEGDVTSGGCPECFCTDWMRFGGWPVWERSYIGGSFDFEERCDLVDDACYLGCDVDISTWRGATLFCD